MQHVATLEKQNYWNSNRMQATFEGNRQVFGKGGSTPHGNTSICTMLCAVAADQSPDRAALLMQPNQEIIDIDVSDNNKA